jgi:outer membrane protein OmpA-like peptidoglycan-associated protein/tetratricopeptide (TPR) repeat protein
MKNLYITITLLATMALTAQNKDTETADKLYSQLEYVDAANAYLKLAGSSKASPYVYRQLADSYYNVFNTKEAARWYAKATETTQDAETYYRYAQMLKAEGRYEDANKQMQKFASMAPADQRAVEFKKDPDYLPKLKSQTKLFDEKLLTDISDEKYSSFGAVLVDNTLYFSSSRNTARKTYGMNEEPYLDMYQTTYSSNGTFSDPVPLSDINTKWHDGPAAITADGNTMYFASESFKDGKFEKEKSGQRTGLIYLFKAIKENGKWTNIQPVPFNGKTWSTGNPAISKDGKTLYFASDRKGTRGGTDLWKVEIKAGNTYGGPVNLGPKVNTEGRENFPYITDDDKLFFASDGRKGFGALDVFMIDLAKGTEAINVGLPVNSPQDDFSFSFNSQKNIGFFSSNRTGVDKIYLATPICGVEALVTVTDIKTGKVLPSAKVSILDERDNVIETRTTTKEGTVNYTIDCDRAYSIQAAMDGYENSSFTIAKTKGGQVTVLAALNPIDKIITKEGVSLNDVFFEYNKSNITKEGAFELNKLVEAMKKNPGIIIMVKGHTDSRGSEEYNMNLSNQRSKATVQYVISKGIDKARISGQGYGESQPRVNCGDNCTEEQHAQNRRIEFLIAKK